MRKFKFKQLKRGVNLDNYARKPGVVKFLALSTIKVLYCFTALLLTAKVQSALIKAVKLTS